MRKSPSKGEQSGVEDLLEYARREAVYLGNGLVKVDSFLNHQVHPDLMSGIGRLLVAPFPDVDRILTAEASGIIPAYAAAQALGRSIVFARKRELKGNPEDVLAVEVDSRTAGKKVRLSVSKPYLPAGQKVLLVDDFLARGNTLAGLVELVRQAGAIPVGLAVVFEKPFEGGRDRLTGLPVHSLIQVHLEDGDQLRLTAGYSTTTSSTGTLARNS